jgi:CubicO group peptidase (beta-lactamase class C family)
LVEAHGGVYRYASERDVDRAFARAEAALNRPMTMLEFYRHLATPLFSVKDGHLRLDLPETSGKALRSQVALLPLRVRFIGMAPHVKTDLIAPDGRLKGYEIQSVNGIRAEQIVDTLLKSTRGDADVDTARLRRNEGFVFAEQLVAMIGTAAPYRLVLRDPATGRTVRINTGGSPLPELQARWAAAFPSEQPPASAAEFDLIDGGRTGRLTIRNFSWFTSADEKTSLPDLFAEAFSEMQAKGTQSLVLDLRGNGGGHDELGRMLLSYLVDKSFRYYEELHANKLEFGFSRYVTAGARSLDPKRFQALPNGKYRFIDHPNWGEWQPTSPVFRGAVYVLMDSASFSTTGELLTHLHSRKRATFLGEESAGGYYGNSSGYFSFITLPNSGLVIRMPLITYYAAVAPGHPPRRGVLPDQPVAETAADLRAAADPALAQALSLARSGAERRTLAAVGELRVGARTATPKPFRAIREKVATAVARGELPSMSLAVVKDCKIIWAEGFGWADQERKIAATPDTLYSLASITKPITASLVLRLAERGKIDLDAPATGYLGQGAFNRSGANVSAITVRQLLNHTAGLPLHWQFFYGDEPVVRRTADQAIARYGFAAQPPGEFFSYSNLGYAALERIVEKVTGRSYAANLTNEIFRPIGMHAVVSTGADLPGAALRYGPNGQVLPPYDFDHRGASAVWASASDLAKFALGSFPERCPGSQPILNASSVAPMRKGSEKPVPYELGWFRNPDDYGFSSVSHSGKMPGVFTTLSIYPSERLAVVVLTNKDEPTEHRLFTVGVAQDLVAASLPSYAAALAAARQPAPAATTPAAPRPPVVNPSLVGRWTGTVRAEAGRLPLLLTITADGKLAASVAGGPSRLLRNSATGATQVVGRLDGSLPGVGRPGDPQELNLNLRLRGGALRGELTAISGGNRPHYALSAYVELGNEAAGLAPHSPPRAK